MTDELILSLITLCGSIFGVWYLRGHLREKWESQETMDATSSPVSRDDNPRLFWLHIIQGWICLVFLLGLALFTFFYSIAQLVAWGGSVLR